MFKEKVEKLLNVQGRNMPSVEDVLSREEIESAAQMWKNIQPKEEQQENSTLGNAMMQQQPIVSMDEFTEKFRTAYPECKYCIFNSLHHTDVYCQNFFLAGWGLEKVLYIKSFPY